MVTLLIVMMETFLIKTNCREFVADYKSADTFLIAALVCEIFGKNYKNLYFNILV